jgi:membrane protease YdiL (CAAX protease family)
VGVTLKILMKALVMPLLDVGPAPTLANSYFADVPGDVWAALDATLYVVIAAGFCEEVFWRGYLFNRLKAWFGDARVVNVTIVVGTSVLFALLHLYQGVYGGVHAFIVSTVIGAIYLFKQRNLWLPIIIHASFDVVYIFLIYAEWGPAVHTLIFD